jgi:hypothetical protein
MPIRFITLPLETARAYRAGEPDANGQTPERRRSDGGGIPCRHCLREVPKGQDYLILAYRPFDSVQPYAETGPIFLCANPCDRHGETSTLPAMFAGWEHLNLRGYGHDERIVYGTGGLVATAEIPARAEILLGRADIAFLHLRSASNNCFQARIERG